MTIRNVWEYAEVEINKLKAPAILLEDFVYLLNKAIQQKINEIYNRYDVNQQSSDDLRVLQSTVKLNPVSSDGFTGKVWTVELPKDYLHLLNCLAEFKGTDVQKGRCESSGEKTIISNCQRLTADLQGGIINNYYMKPSHKKPYYYIVNNNPTDGSSSLIDTEVKNREGYKPSFVETGEDSSVPEYRFYAMKEQYDRTSNQSTVNLEIHVGNSNWDVDSVHVTYLKSPMYVSMTQEDLLSVTDSTQALEFPDYVCYEIINTFTKLLLENASDPRLQTQLAVNQSIATPGQK